MPRKSWALALFGALVMLLALGGGCKCSRTPAPTSATGPAPSVRLYLVSSVAGALEPCGCVQDMLGGVDHFASLLARDASVPHLLLGAGPLLFKDPVPDAKERDQDVLKARAIGEVMAGLKLAGWAPGANDWAGGPELLGEITKDRLAVFGANLDEGFTKTRVFSVGSERVGVVGVSTPSIVKGVPASDPRAALAAGLAALRAEGARIFVALAAMPRGEALRVAEAVPGFHVMLIGKPVDRGEANDVPTPPLEVGKTLVVEAPNHLQSVAVVDLFVKGGKYAFADGSGIAREERRTSLLGRKRDLQTALGRAGISSADRAARRKDLEGVEAELVKLAEPTPLPEGSAFRYELVEVREKLGGDAATAARLAAYYKAVNEHNRQAFMSVLPAPAPPGESGYVGADACSGCHASEREFWDRTPHHSAYATLARQNKEFNLECVGCHVTGYEAPGGSTVAHVDGLQAVQCEVCHGPGSRHADKPKEPGLVTIPERSLCAAKCHHPPHVHADWNVDFAWPVIVGKGHERTAKDAGKKGG
ncbi:MAG TPA: multiheme c-type cytochrome [Polyangiaceae bacterium]|nr:multiheme c-type cytochrome [Polyangiaceae bacterium]